ncbi:MAG: glycosyltransferase family 8 protein [Alphaproteobacteria bacterium]|nr:glycosyltransferase family 8 protein [Alphaproteobacteria bacterium]
MNKYIPVFLASDENYAKYMAVTIQSIISNTKEKINFYILDGGIAEITKNKIKTILDNTVHQIEFLKIDISLFEKFPIVAHFSINTYFRYLIPHLKPEIKKALYIDTDMIIHGDISELYHSDLKGKGLGGVVYIEEDFASFTNYKEELGLSQKHRYFNAGLLLIDCDYWRNNKTIDSLFKKTIALYDKLKMCDQDVLNLVFECSYTELSPKYNIVVDVTSDFIDLKKYISSFKGCIVLHYTGGRGMRPWVKKDCLENHYFWKYAIETPFHNDLQLELIQNQLNTLIQKKKIFKTISLVKIKLFKFLPIITIKIKKNKKRIYFFGMPIISIRNK